jgi:hypothetical protein
MAAKTSNRKTWKGDYEWIIKVLVPENPKKPGSNAYQRFALYRSGMTPNAYVLACKNAPGSDDARIDLTWDTERRFIKIEPPSKS